MGKSQNNMSTLLINEEKDAHLPWCSGCANKISIFIPQICKCTAYGNLEKSILTLTGENVDY